MSSLIVQASVTVLLADFVSGAVHWLVHGWLNWHVLLFAVLVINANQIHKWAHMNSAEVPTPVRWLQKLHLLQTPRHHGKHHAGARTTHYCVITNFLNPLLEEVMFWSRVERVIERLTGVKRRREAEELKLLGLSSAARPSFT